LDNYAYWNLNWKYFKMLLQCLEKKSIFLNIMCKNIVWHDANREKKMIEIDRKSYLKESQSVGDK